MLNYSFNEFSHIRWTSIVVSYMISLYYCCCYWCVCVCVDIWQSIVCVIVSFWGLKTGKSIIDLYSWPKALVMVVVNEWPKPKPPWSVYDYGIIILWLHQLPSSPLTSLPYITLYYPSSVNNWSLAHLLCRCCISIEKLHVLPRLTSNNCFYRN